MSWLEAVVYVPLAFFSNTALPMAFDPVLIHFAAHHSTASACIFALVASAGAGLAAATDIKLLDWFHRRGSGEWPRWLPHWRGRTFYLWTFLFALLPLPFAVVRLALLRHPPEMVRYCLAVSLGRLPRYLATVFLWPVLGLPSGTTGILLGAVVFVAALKLLIPDSHKRQDNPGFHWLSESRRRSELRER